MKTPSPAQSLFFLVLAGVAVAGWAYGLHWKRVASGDLFSADEKMMIRLQDQITVLSEENRALHEQIREVEGAGKGVPAASGDAPAPPSVAGGEADGAAPVLPAPPQRIETH